jgi:hypothetical protein
MFEPVVSRARKDSKSRAQLSDMQQPLEERMMDYRRYLPDINALIGWYSYVFFIEFIGHNYFKVI